MENIPYEFVKGLILFIAGFVVGFYNLIEKLLRRKKKC